MTSDQIQLEYQLIEEMKQEYHQKVINLEKEKQSLVNNVSNPKEGLNIQAGKINIQKIENLEN